LWCPNSISHIKAKILGNKGIEKATPQNALETIDISLEKALIEAKGVARGWGIYFDVHISKWYLKFHRKPT